LGSGRDQGREEENQRLYEEYLAERNQVETGRSDENLYQGQGRELLETHRTPSPIDRPPEVRRTSGDAGHLWNEARDLGNDGAEANPDLTSYNDQFESTLENRNDGPDIPGTLQVLPEITEMWPRLKGRDGADRLEWMALMIESRALLADAIFLEKEIISMSR
jgi:hypothetical protein